MSRGEEVEDEVDPALGHVEEGHEDEESVEQFGGGSLAVCFYQPESHQSSPKSDQDKHEGYGYYLTCLSVLCLYHISDKYPFLGRFNQFITVSIESSHFQVQGGPKVSLHTLALIAQSLSAQSK